MSAPTFATAITLARATWGKTALVRLTWVRDSCPSSCGWVMRDATTRRRRDRQNLRRRIERACARLARALTAWRRGRR